MAKIALVATFIVLGVYRVSGVPPTYAPDVTTRIVDSKSQQSGNNATQNCHKPNCFNTPQELKAKYEPEIEKLKNKIIQQLAKRCNHLSKGTWVHAMNGTIPKNAIISGWDPDRPYWLGRANFRCGLQVPCKLTAVHRTCWTAWNNTEISATSYEVLVHADTKWVPHTSSEVLPEKAVVGGRRVDELGRDEKLFVGRDYIGTRIVPGYVFEFNRTLLHSTSFKNEMKLVYEILVYL